MFDHINSHLDEPLYVKDLADVAYLSRSRFFDVFHDLTGLSPMGFVRQQRLVAASKLLLSSSLTIGQIALAVGFPSQFHFSRVFKEYAGVNLSEFRE